MTHNQSSELLLVVTTFSKLDDAQVLARLLIENSLAACVQIREGIHSIYRWDGKVCEEQEVVLAAKTAADKWLEIAQFIKGHHPYDLPEILGFHPQQYEEQYGKWVHSEVKSLP
jgi:periplasmic divalent cation tolerance protein